MSEKHVEELKRAHKRIKSKERIYVCDALRLDVNHKDYSKNIWSKESKQIKDAIDAAINGEYSVTTWLQKQGFNTGTNFDSSMREYRLAWINKMIEYWKDKE